MFKRNNTKVEKIKANPKRSLKKSDKPHHLLIIYPTGPPTVEFIFISKKGSNYFKSL